MTFSNPVTWQDVIDEFPNATTDTQRFQLFFNEIVNVGQRHVLYLPRNRTFQITAPLELPRSPNWDKKVLVMSSDPDANGSKTKIEFRFNGNQGALIEESRAAMALRSNCRFSDIHFDGENAGYHLIYLAPQVTNPNNSRQFYNQDDTDSSFIDCEFTKFRGSAAIIQNGRNTLVENCLFDINGEDTDTVGFWHYFHNIKEDITNGGTPIGISNEPGECRKNRIFGNIFKMKGGTAIRGGYMPKDWQAGKPTDNLYGDIQQFQVSNNNCEDCRFAHFKLEDNQELEGLSFDRNDCRTSVNLSEYIRIDNGKLKSVMLTGRPDSKDYKGNRLVNHCLHITNDIKTQKSRIYVDTKLAHFNSYAIIAGKDKDGDYSALKILGDIPNDSSSFRGTNGVAYYNKSGNLTVLNDPDANKIGSTCYEQ